MSSRSPAPGPRYAWGLAVLALALLGQLWGTGVLLLTRQPEPLLLASTVAAVLWFWCFWGLFLRRRRAGLLLSGGGLLLSLIMNAIGLLDMLDQSGVLLTG